MVARGVVNDLKRHEKVFASVSVCSILRQVYVTSRGIKTFLLRSNNVLFCFNVHRSTKEVCTNLHTVNRLEHALLPIVYV